MKLASQQADASAREAVREKALSGVRVVLTGSVQGCGFRPRLVRLAAGRGWSGFCRNSDQGVEVVVIRPSLRVEDLLAELHGEFSGGCEVFSAEQIELTLEECGEGFCIVESQGNLPCRVEVPLDVAICETCIRDVSDPENRRAGYLLTTCSECGPRYSVLTEMPFDRMRTTLDSFQCCPACNAEYTNPDDRRYHAQTIACQSCGPRVWSEDPEGRVLDSADFLEPVLTILRSGGIIALRGIGGYQLLVDATDGAAVAHLRDCKGRPEKPLAVMCGSIEMAETIAELSDLERRTLASPGNPIVLVKRRDGSALADGVSQGLSTVGILLPTTALHGELLNRFEKPLVVTSGNREGDPLSVTREEALTGLREIADLFVHHDREIAQPIDDSVVRCIAGKVVTIRAGRGLAPVPLPLESLPPLIALGGHQKNGIALSNGNQAVLSPHVGDLGTLSMRKRWIERLESWQALYQIRNPAWIIDQHPDYYPTFWAECEQPSAMSVWHHHAHVVTGMVENGWLGREVLGIACDGSGLGPDGTIWGGEFLRVTVESFKRVGALRSFPLLGGEQATKELSRSAVGVLSQLTDVPWEFLANRMQISSERCELLVGQTLRKDTPRTTSCGRLFDAASSLILGINEVHGEGWGAMRLESTCGDSDCTDYRFDIGEGDILQLDWRPAFVELIADLLRGENPSVMAVRFHRGLSKAMVSLALLFDLPVVLGGGVFQNQVLVEAIVNSWPQGGPPLGLPGRLPPNDGGLAVGQLVIGAAQRHRNHADFM